MANPAQPCLGTTSGPDIYPAMPCVALAAPGELYCSVHRLGWRKVVSWVEPSGQWQKLEAYSHAQSRKETA